MLDGRGGKHVAIDPVGAKDKVGDAFVHQRHGRVAVGEVETHKGAKSHPKAGCKGRVLRRGQAVQQMVARKEVVLPVLCNQLQCEEAVGVETLLELANPEPVCGTARKYLPSGAEHCLSVIQVHAIGGAAAIILR